MTETSSQLFCSGFVVYNRDWSISAYGTSLEVAHGLLIAEQFFKLFYIRQCGIGTWQIVSQRQNKEERQSCIHVNLVYEQSWHYR